MTHPVDDLLQSLGWPPSDADKKGTLEWQGALDNPDHLPPTAALIVTPKSIRATVLNVEPSSTVQPHFQAEWDISSAAPLLKKHQLAGVNLLDNPQADPALNFTSLVALVSSRPKLEIMGYRNKKSGADGDIVPVAKNNV